MIHNFKSTVLVLLVSLFSVMFPVAAFADLPGVATDGGLQVGNPKCDRYWFNISGVVKIDERQYFGETAASPIQPYNQQGIGSYRSGAFIRDVGVTLNGGVGENFTYTLAFDYGAQTRTVAIDDAFLTYWGLQNLMPNFTFSVGQVSPGFCLNCAESSKWIPFLERNMSTYTFGPQNGLGISGNTYNNNYSLTVAITQQPKAGNATFAPSYATSSSGIIRKRDLWQLSARFTWAPISDTGRVFQVGASGHIQEYSNTGLRFRAVPEMRSGNSTTLLDTASFSTSTAPVGPNTTILIAAKNQKTVDLEMLGIYGPWSGAAEYQKVWVARGKWNPPGAGSSVFVKQGDDLTFNGYHAQVSYILTGESRPLKKSNGTLGQIKPTHSYGAWEVSARYSFITLNDKDIFGGLAHNTTASLGWYANNNVKVIAEYVYSKQHRNYPGSLYGQPANAYKDHRNVSSLGARLQIVF